MSLGVFIQQHKRAAHHPVLLVSRSSNLDLVCECFIYRQWAMQTASSRRDCKHRLSPRGRSFSSTPPPPPFLFLSATPSLLKGLSSFIFPWQCCRLSFIKKHCQQLILKINFSFLLWTIDYKSCIQILQHSWEVSVTVWLISQLRLQILCKLRLCIFPIFQ